jgi:uncharacterized protein (UPF0332 family)
MLNLQYNYRQKKKASTKLALGLSECEAAELLLQEGLYRECVVHLYFCCFYISQSFLSDKITANANHKGVENLLHRHYVRIPDTRPHQFRNLVPTYSGNLSPVIPETCPHLI